VKQKPHIKAKHL